MTLVISPKFVYDIIKLSSLFLKGRSIVNIQKLLKKYFVCMGPLFIMLMAVTSVKLEENFYIFAVVVSMLWGHFLSYYFSMVEAFITITLLTLVMIATSPLPLIYSLYIWAGMSFAHILVMLIVTIYGKEEYSMRAKKGEAIYEFDR
ncbi:MAG: hypothetical protein NT091_03680 [Candidatus Falkowbacteria bacterium]|nr:hypothetical protein [Candidatus Falkowbacteria bacterium]